MAIDVTLTYRSSAVNGHAHYGCIHVTLDWRRLMIDNDNLMMLMIFIESAW